MAFAAPSSLLHYQRAGGIPSRSDTPAANDLAELLAELLQNGTLRLHTEVESAHEDGEGSNRHISYRVLTSLQVARSRRFQQFKSLHKYLQRSLPGGAQLPALPARKKFKLYRRTLDPAHVESKRILLDAYIKALVDLPAAASNAAVAAFLLRGDVVPSHPVDTAPQPLADKGAQDSKRPEARSISSSLESATAQDDSLPETRTFSGSDASFDEHENSGAVSTRSLLLAPQQAWREHPLLPKLNSPAAISLSNYDDERDVEFAVNQGGMLFVTFDAMGTEVCVSPCKLHRAPRGSAGTHTLNGVVTLDGHRSNLDGVLDMAAMRGHARLEAIP